MKREHTIILMPLTEKKIFEIKDEIINEAIERKIHNSTIVTANLIRNTIYVTSSNEDFIQELSANKDFAVNQVALPSMN